MIDLDALKRPPLTVVFEGKSYTLAEATLDKIAQMAKLQDKASADAATDPNASFARLADLLALLAPTMPADAISRLEQTQAAKLIEAWQDEATTAAKSDGKDAEGAIKDPTSPG